MEADDMSVDDAEEPTRREAVGRGDDEIEEAERAFVAGLIARGEAAPTDEQGKLPPGATHELIEDDEGRQTVRRHRFSAF